MSTPNDLRNYGEATADDIWRDREEHREAEEYHRAHRHHAEQALREQFNEREAHVLPTEWGDVTLSLNRGSYAYNSPVVDKELFPLIERDGLSDQWNQFVRHEYRIDRRWLHQLAKRGKDYRDVLDRIIIAPTGVTASFKGPSLRDMGGYAVE